MQSLLPSHFLGYRRKAGRPGIRNHLLVLSVCGLNAAGALKVHAGLPKSLLISSAFGRGQIGADKQLHDSHLSQLACHPNIGAVVLLAPDAELRAQYQSIIEASGRPCAGFSLQETKEDSEQLAANAISAGRQLIHELDDTRRQICSLSELAIAIECGHSDATSGIIANPLAGDLADQVVAQGGAVVISETMEWTGTETGLYARCREPEIAQKLESLIRDRHALADAANIDIHYGNPGPQNHVGGITTLEEKSLGAIAKGGTSDIVGALDQGQLLPAAAGLYLMDTPSLSPESISSMVAASAQLVVFTTGQGNPYGSAVAPTIKLTANPKTAKRLADQIDFDGSTAFTGTTTRQSLLPELAKTLIEVCEGKQVAVEILGEGFESISRLSASI